MGTPSANPYAQLFLGFRSLAVKIFIFVVMAALLAWALGGTLWPRPQVRTVGETVTTSGGQYSLVVRTGEGHGAAFALAKVQENGRLEIAIPVEGQPLWHFALPPVASGNGLALAYRSGVHWRIYLHGEEKTFAVANQVDAAAWLQAFADGRTPAASSSASATPN